MAICKKCKNYMWKETPSGYCEACEKKLQNEKLPNSSIPNTSSTTVVQKESGNMKADDNNNQAVLSEEEQRKRRKELAQQKIAAKKNKNKKTVVIISICAAALLAVALLFILVFIPKQHYEKGLSIMSEEQWEAAREEFVQAGNYSDAHEKVKEVDYKLGLLLFDEGKWDAAKEKFILADDYNDAAEKAKEADYQKAKQLLEAGNYEDALPIFKAIRGYNDSETQYKECIYQRANHMLSSADYDSAYKEFISIKGYKDVDTILASNVELKIAIGNSITLGTYGSKPIEWMIIGKENDKVILLSRDILDSMAVRGQRADDMTEFNRGAKVKSRANSILKEAFSSSEKSLISEITILTKDQVEKYLPSASDRVCSGGAWWTSTNGTRNGRTEYGPFTYTSDYFAFIVNNNGGIDSRDAAGTFGVRPSITISSSALRQLVQENN